ncbi:MAG: SirB2 family protein [Gammaproteobacteria bacterium]|nr:SirB2 family protein [Gammaproteobacteria bacterium]
MSLTGFALRGYWMLTGSPLLDRGLTKTVPHVVDTVLLVSGITMLVMASLSPLSQSWLTVKLIALLLYIVLGSLALKRGKTRNAKAGALVLAMLTFFYIASVALTRNPASIFYSF